MLQRLVVYKEYRHVGKVCVQAIGQSWHLPTFTGSSSWLYAMPLSSYARSALMTTSRSRASHTRH